MTTVIDFSQVVHAAIAQEAAQNSVAEFGGDFIRHMILDSLRANIVKSRGNGDFVVACDSSSWRVAHYPEYKWKRRQARAIKEIDKQKGPDWDVVGDVFREVKIALDLYFPVKVVQVEGCEADDIIGYMARRATEYKEKLHIISGDKDFQQLQNEFITQYSPTLGKDVVCENGQEFLKLHILKGDSGDGIPNVLSPNDQFSGTDMPRQKSITANLTEEWLAFVDVDQPMLFGQQFRAGKVWHNLKGKVDPSDLEKQIARNAAMIDLRNTPVTLVNELAFQFKSGSNGDVESAMRYMASKNLNRLMDRVTDFAV